MVFLYHNVKKVIEQSNVLTSRRLPENCYEMFHEGSLAKKLARNFDYSESDNFKKLSKLTQILSVLIKELRLFRLESLG